MKQTIDQAYSPETLRRLQLVEYDILKKFDAMCKKHHLEYYAMYGTLLGAVRHKGIIPWDDDIDIAMPRKDYDKLLELVPREFGDGYSFLDANVDPRYPFVTGRIMKKGTEFRMLSMKNSPCELGIFLDIFVMENLPDNEKERKRLIRKAWIMEKLCILRNTPFPNVPYRGLKRVLVYGVCGAASICLKVIPARVLHQIRQRLVEEYKDQKTEYIGILNGINMEKEIFRREMIYPLGKLPYEDMEIPVPHDVHGMLSQEFGPDYMTPLPEGKRSSIIPYKLSFGDEDDNA